MTKQEVYQNIRYNEDLVNSYTRNLNNLRARVNDLNAQIDSYNGQINQLDARIRGLRTQIDELKQLRIKYQGLQNEFADRQAKRWSRFTLNFSRGFHFKFILSYISGMKNLLSGGEYRRAYDGLSAAVNTIAHKIRSIQEEIDGINKDISSKRRRIDSIWGDIRYNQSQINQMNSNLSYRRQRITYWKRQLRYAT